MPADISLGSNYEIDENSNGNLVIKDSTDTVVLKHTDGGGFSFGVDAEFESLSTDDLDTSRTWQDVTASRSLNEPYTNNTNSEIWATCTVEADADGTSVGINWVGDLSINTQKPDEKHLTIDAEDFLTIQVIVPPSTDYEAFKFGDTADFSLRQWMEFRP